jgi:Ca2+-binding RTX toxin-like protein
MSVDLAAGNNVLRLSSVSNIGSVSNVGTTIGGSGSDTITYNTAINNGSVDLGAGNDNLTLANLTNRVSVANVETTQGGTGNDTIVLTGNAASMVIGGGGIDFISGNTGVDTFVFDQNSSGNYSTIQNFSSANHDLIGLDTTGSGTLTTNTYNLGGAGIADGTDIAGVANAAARLATVLSNGGNGGFVYEQDTGELYYSGTGNFSGGGTLVGIITTNGSTPWTYDPTKFTQV